MRLLFKLLSLTDLAFDSRPVLQFKKFQALGFASLATDNCIEVSLRCAP